MPNQIKAESGIQKTCCLSACTQNTINFNHTTQKTLHGWKYSETYIKEKCSVQGEKKDG